MNAVQRFSDGFQNLIARLGTSRDKSSGNEYTTTGYSHTELLAAYRSSSVAKCIVDMPAEDMCREWRAWQAEADQITKLEAEEKRLGLVQAVQEALKRSRLYGGAAIYIGTDDESVEEPLDPARIGLGGVRYLTVLDRQDMTASNLQLDPRLEGYGLPQHYTLRTASEGMVNIHPSRMVVLRGESVPDNLIARTQEGWGDSVLTTALEKIKHLDATVANVASLVFEAKIDVVKIKGLTDNLRSGGAEYESLMLRRFGLAMTGKGINGTLMLDAEEEYNQKTASFSTLPEIMDRFMQVCASAAQIPMTRLFGMSPGGLNATGESDARNYYDRVRQSQTIDLQPAMSILDECLIRSALGDRPAELHYNWRPLWTPSEKERAEVADKLTTSAERMSRMDFPPDILAMALTNALTETGSFPGLEGLMDGYTTLDEDAP